MTTKERVTALLENQRGRFVSGAAMAEQLNLTRGAVWKAVVALRAEGYGIEAVTNKGYRLPPDDDKLSRVGIENLLPPPVREGVQLHVFDTLSSTNTKAKEFALAGRPHGTVVVADAQTAGKGRYGRSFLSPAGAGLYLSFVLHNVWETLPTLITAFAAVAVCETIEALCPGRRPSVKWVNDVFWNNKKICGISTEAVMDLENNVLQWVVLGIGLNLRQTALPEDLQPIVGALDVDIPRNRFAAELIRRILAPPADRQDLLARYRARLFVLGRTVRVMAAEPYEAVAVDLDDEGRLLVRKATGEVVTLFSGEIGIKLLTSDASDGSIGIPNW